jgi:3-dehydroquinate synthase II
MRLTYFKALPYRKEEVTLALESGVDGLIVPDDQVRSAKSLSRSAVLGESQVAFITLRGKADEERAEALIRASAAGEPGAPALVVLARGWEVIPVENLLAAVPAAVGAASPAFAVEAGGMDEAGPAGGILERGVDALVFTSEALSAIRPLVAAFRFSTGKIALGAARITRIAQAGMGHRVCVDTTSLLRSGQGMLVGNSAAFTFLVNAETEHNEYVAARPFRINAGPVHAYALLPGDRTAYLEELSAGKEVLIAGHDGESFPATVGRVKVERRPLLLVEAELACPGSADRGIRGAVFLQNAETIRLVTPEGRAVSVVELQEGDAVLCRADSAGRHFGMRISEEIRER